jgi:hypothetical protein
LQGVPERERVVNLGESVALGLVTDKAGGYGSNVVGGVHVVGSSCARWLGGLVGSDFVVVTFEAEYFGYLVCAGAAYLVGKINHCFPAVAHVKAVI